MPTLFYAYWLGLFLIGPFETLPACQAAQQVQLAWGTKEDVSECWVIIDTRGTTYSIASPTYGAPLTPAKDARRQQFEELLYCRS